MYTSAMMNLGEIPDPVSGETKEKPEQAKEIIDIIAMLEEKTEGNLSEQESITLSEILYQARMMYLTKTKKVKT